MPLALDQIRPEDNSPGSRRCTASTSTCPRVRSTRPCARCARTVGGIDFQIVDGVHLRAQQHAGRTRRRRSTCRCFRRRRVQGRHQRAVEMIIAEGHPEELHHARSASWATPSRRWWSSRSPTSRACGTCCCSTRARRSSAGRCCARATRERSEARRSRRRHVDRAALPAHLHLAPARRSTTGCRATAALAIASARLEMPIVVLDRSVLRTRAGFLNLSRQLERADCRSTRVPGRPRAVGLRSGAAGTSSGRWTGRAGDREPATSCTTSRARPAARGAARAASSRAPSPSSRAGSTRTARSPTDEVLMGGEIVDGQKRGKITIAPGTTVQQAIVAVREGLGREHPTCHAARRDRTRSRKVLAAPEARGAARTSRTWRSGRRRRRRLQRRSASHPRRADGARAR